MFDWDYSKYKKDNSLEYHKIKRECELMEVSKKDAFKTKFGSAYRNGKYYHVGKIGLHRLIYEDYHNISLLSTTKIHHLDGNSLNNNILNLIAVDDKQHGIYHHLLAQGVSTANKNKYLYQIISDNSPNIYYSHSRWFYEFEYSYFFKDDKLDKTYKECIFADSLEQLEYMVKLFGLFWEENQ